MQGRPICHTLPVMRVCSKERTPPTLWYLQQTHITLLWKGSMEQNGARDVQHRGPQAPTNPNSPGG